ADERAKRANHEHGCRRGTTCRSRTACVPKGAPVSSAETGPRSAGPDEVARGERFYQRLLDDEVREVPVSLRATSAGHLEPVDIAPSRYFDPEFHRREVERVWGRTWQMACREEQIPEVGDSLVYEIADWSLIVVRTAPQEIRAFHNSCLHRG